MNEKMKQLEERIALLSTMPEKADLLQRAKDQLNELQAEINAGSIYRFDPQVVKAVLDNWIEDHPVTLYADNGTRPVTFRNPGELRAYAR